MSTRSIADVLKDYNKILDDIPWENENLPTERIGTKVYTEGEAISLELWEKIMAMPQLTHVAPMFARIPVPPPQPLQYGSSRAMATLSDFPSMTTRHAELMSEVFADMPDHVQLADYARNFMMRLDEGDSRYMSGGTYHPTHRVHSREDFKTMGKEPIVKEVLAGAVKIDGDDLRERVRKHVNP